MNNKGIVLLLGCFMACPLLAQSFMASSNEDFGPRHTLYLDSQVYPISHLEREQLRIVYDCRLALEEMPPKPEPIIIQVGNMREVIEGEGNPDMEIRAEYVLQLGDRYTKFVSLGRFQSDSVFLSGGTIYKAARFMDRKANVVFGQDCYCMDRTDGKLIFTGRLAADNYLYEEEIPQIEWTFLDSTQVLCGYLCHLAEGVFRGRRYLAWYTEEIPSSAGPWKLQGLPGAILQAQDSDHLVEMTATAVLSGCGYIVRTEYPYIRVSRKQYRKLLGQMQRDPFIFSANHSSRSAMKAMVDETHMPQPLPKHTILELK